MPSAAKAGSEFVSFMRGLKPPPPAVLNFSEYLKYLEINLLTEIDEADGVDACM
jgi:hypothetical protein